MSSKHHWRNHGLFGKRQEEYSARTVIAPDIYERATLMIPSSMNRLWLLQRLVNRLTPRLPSFASTVEKYRRDLYNITE